MEAVLARGTRRQLDQESDESLVRRSALGEEAALAELFDRHAHIAYGLAFRVLRDRTLAEDAVQEAFLNVWQSAASYSPHRARVRAWIMVHVHRRAVDLVRSEERRRARLDDLGAHEPIPEAAAADAAELRAQRRAIREALASLPEPSRQLLELAYYGGLTQSELARALGIPLGTVKSRTHAALVRLRERLADGPVELSSARAPG